MTIAERRLAEKQNQGNQGNQGELAGSSKSASKEGK